MSRLSKMTVEKRQIKYMINHGDEEVGFGTGRASIASSRGDYDGFSQRGLENFITPDGAFPAFLQTAAVVAYERPVDWGDASMSDDEMMVLSEKSAGTGRKAITERSEIQQTAARDGALVTTTRSGINTSRSNVFLPATGSVRAGSPGTARLHYTVFGSGSGTVGATARGKSPAGMQFLSTLVKEDPYDREIDEVEAKEVMRIEAETARRSQQPVVRAEAGSPKDAAETDEEELKQPLENKCLRSLVREVWSAEQDGSISIRDPCTGRHVRVRGLNKQFCRRFPTTFATCILQVRNLVFAGYNDGYLRAFDVATKDLVFEKKKHAGAINAMVQWKNNLIFTGSDDFRISMWRVGKEQPPDQRLQQRRGEKDAAARESAEIARCQSEAENVNSSVMSTRSYGSQLPPQSEARKRLDSERVPNITPLAAAILTSRVNDPSASAVLNTIRTVASNTVTVDYRGNCPIVQSAISEENADLPSFLHQLMGHGNRVRCLRVEGDFLFSGGDDGLVRCWDIHQRTEVLNKFPILAHKEGVLDLTFVDNCLLTAGRGGISIWDIDSCTNQHTFPFEEINRISVDPTSLLLWACSAKDGIVTVIDLYSFEVLGKMNEFENASIKTIANVTNSVATRLFFIVPNKGVTIVYSESSDTGMPQSYEPINHETKLLYTNLDESRERTLANEKTLRELRSLLWYIKGVDNYRKESTVKIMASQKSLSFKQEYLERCLISLMKTRFNARQRILAHTMASNNERQLMFITLLKWFHFRRWGKDAFFRDFVTNSLTEATNRDLITRHISNALHHVDEIQMKRREGLIVEFLRNFKRKSLLLRVYNTWTRFTAKAKENRRRDRLLTSANFRQYLFLAHVYFGKLYRHFINVRRREVNYRACQILTRRNEWLRLYVIFKKWMSFHKLKASIKMRVKVVCRVAASNDLRLLRNYYDMLRSNVIRKATKRGLDETQLLDVEISEMNYLITNEPTESVPELDQKISELEAQITEMLARMKKNDDALPFLTERETRLSLESTLERKRQRRAQRRLERQQLEAAKGGHASGRTHVPLKGPASIYRRCGIAMFRTRPNAIQLRLNLDIIVRQHLMAPVAAAGEGPTLVKEKATKRSGSKSPSRRAKSPGKALGKAKTGKELKPEEEKRVKTPKRTGKSPLKVKKSPIRGGKSPLKVKKSPLKTTKSPLKASKSPIRGGKSPIRGGKSPLRGKKSPSKGKRAASVAPELPEVIFEAGVRGGRERLQRLTLPEVLLNDQEPWRLDVDAVTEATAAQLGEALMPLRESVVAWDYLRNAALNHPLSRDEGAPAVEGGEEFARNAKTIRLLFERELQLAVESSVKPPIALSAVSTEGEEAPPEGGEPRGEEQAVGVKEVPVSVVEHVTLSRKTPRGKSPRGKSPKVLKKKKVVAEEKKVKTPKKTRSGSKTKIVKKKKAPAAEPEQPPEGEHTEAPPLPPPAVALEPPPTPPIPLTQEFRDHLGSGRGMSDEDDELSDEESKPTPPAVEPTPPAVEATPPAVEPTPPAVEPPKTPVEETPLSLKEPQKNDGSNADVSGGGKDKDGKPFSSGGKAPVLTPPKMDEKNKKKCCSPCC